MVIRTSLAVLYSKINLKCMMVKYSIKSERESLKLVQTGELRHTRLSFQGLYTKLRLEPEIYKTKFYVQTTELLGLNHKF